MSKKILTDYYPVYKEINGSPVMLNAEELSDLALKCGFTTFQTVILLLKNAFEGHVYLNYQIRPDQLFCKGTIQFQAKPELMIQSFYEHFSQYKAGLNQIEKLLQERQEDLDEISFELLVHSILVNHIIRFPVSIFSYFDIRTLKGIPIINQQAMDQHFELVLLGERLLGEYELIEKVNLSYAEKFKEFGQQLRIKEEVFSHFQRKLALALYPNIHTEEELDELMYKKLIEEKLNCTHQNLIKCCPAGPANSETSFGMGRIREKTKILYRSASKNCFEVHSAKAGENCFPELNQLFLEANTIYNEPVSALPEALLQYMRMVLLLSKILIYRKTHGFVLADSRQLLSDISEKEVLVSKDDLKFLRRNLDDQLVSYRIKCFTDYKMKFVLDDELTEIHKHFLHQQIDFIDEQILQIQSDIKEILKLKSQATILNASKN